MQSHASEIDNMASSMASMQKDFQERMTQLQTLAQVIEESASKTSQQVEDDKVEFLCRMKDEYQLKVQELEQQVSNHYTIS